MDKQYKSLKLSTNLSLAAMLDLIFTDYEFNFEISDPSYVQPNMTENGKILNIKTMLKEKMNKICEISYRNI